MDHQLDTFVDTSSLSDYVESVINRLFESPAERMMLKLFFDNYEIDQIARFAGLSSDTTARTVWRGVARLEKQIKCSFNSLQLLCTTYSPVIPNQNPDNN
jgi:DNA-directed RNA polymerase specialized sigma24 family protein